MHSGEAGILRGHATLPLLNRPDINDFATSSKKVHCFLSKTSSFHCTWRLLKLVAGNKNRSGIRSRSKYGPPRAAVNPRRPEGSRSRSRMRTDLILLSAHPCSLAYRSWQTTHPGLIKDPFASD
ncbi:hypothetical protein PoB_000268300 [Plakobranchus ocellatus]|uniref:Uncharacterized protein n=1 Tax=Plakobranchus ocellatus TaxID=259542 RepID=A0AAV3Y1Q6_9GAST|nr:hypothetical protein PoB_000268300 [Plakobranchus ocellatus]